jgi:hypothetical protein
MFHLIIVETTGVIRAIYPNYLLPRMKKIANSEILQVAKILIEHQLGYTFDKIEIM